MGRGWECQKLPHFEDKILDFRWCVITPGQMVGFKPHSKCTVSVSVKVSS